MSNFVTTLRLTLLLGVFLVAVIAGRPCSGIAAEGTPPNILFVIADDWGRHASAYGTPWVKTPAFDSVARDGLLFEQAYTPTAKCAPSRAAILTGRYPWQLEAAANHWAYFPAKFKTWPEALRANGWLVGVTQKGWGPGIARDGNDKPRQMTGKPYNRRKLTPPTTGISANDYSANFADFLDDAPPGKPWCFWCGPVEPHRNYEPQSGVNKGGKSLDQIDRVPGYWPDEPTVRHDMLDYAYEVEYFDQQVGKVLADLDRRGLRESTLVIVTSDHGMPFPRVKGYAYLDSNHIPLAIRWPAGIVHPGRKVPEFVNFVDIAATILDVAGLSNEQSGMQPISGQSWRPLFQEQSPSQSRESTIIGRERNDVGRPNDEGYPIRGIVTRDYLYLKNFEPTRWPAANPETGYLDTDASPTKTLILEQGRKERIDRYWQWNFGMRPGQELFSVPSDPDCVVNLANNPEYANVCDRLSKNLTAALTAQQDPRILGRGAEFDRYPTANEKARGWYERYKKGETQNADWILPGDVEPTPLEPTLAPKSQ